MRLIMRWLVTAAAVAMAAVLVPGIEIAGNAWAALFVMAAVLGLVNAFIRPLLQFLSCGAIVLTLGLFTLVINAFTFSLASTIAQNMFGVGFVVDGFWPSFWGGIVVSVVSVLLSTFLPDEAEGDRHAS